MSIVGDEDHDTDDYLLVVTDRGFGKRTPLSAYNRQGRGGQGVTTIKLGNEKRGGLVGALAVPLEAEILLVTDRGVVIRTDLVDVRPLGRATQGVSLMRTDDGASVVAVARVVEDDVDDDPSASSDDPPPTDDGPDEA